jgi:Domain of unknown function (DUF5671)
MGSDLEAYIAKAQEKNLPDQQIKETLIHAGWPKESVEQAFHEPNNISMPPPPVAQVGMWTGFLYIIFFICLYICATAIGFVFHNAVDKIFLPSYETYSDFVGIYDATIQGSLAAIIVSFPLFAFLTFMLKKQITKNPTIKNLRSRKILIYITLIGAFLIMIGHVIGTVYGFLNGTANSLNSLGHLCVTLLIAGSIFAYFIAEVKHDSNA